MKLRSLLHLLRPRVSRARIESNRWLRLHAASVKGSVLSIGSRDDADGEGGYYRDYFVCADNYTTSDVDGSFGCDLSIDVRVMDGIADGSFDCVFCSGVLEHVDDYVSALAQIRRVLRPGGVLLLGVPFRQPIHLPPTDYWRFTEFGVKHLLKDGFEKVTITPVNESVPSFPAAYWVEATRSCQG